jgi:hypothetical protein
LGRSSASSTQIGFIDDRHGVLFGANLGDHLMAAALYFSANSSWAGKLHVRGVDAPTFGFSFFGFLASWLLRT